MMTYRFTAIIICLLVVMGCHYNRPLPERLDCVIALGAHEDTTRGLISGYNYHLLESFATELNLPLSIEISRTPIHWLDSLRNGSISILAVPFNEDLSQEIYESLSVSIPVDSLSLWLFARENRSLLDTANKWLGAYHRSEDYEMTRKKFLRTYDPIKRANAGGRSSFLGPYDDMIKNAASELGWDWRLLAAVIYQESRFSMKARSSKGAMGLMQVLPSTAGMEPKELWSPEVNIKSGTAYLKMVFRQFRYIEDVRERQRITLAAYNAGHNRIRTLAQCADSLGIDSSNWESLKTAIPYLQGFSGVETTRYVERVDSLYEAFCCICP